MSVTIILDGGIKTCCSVTSTEVVEKTVREWLGESERLTIIDRQAQPWEPDQLAQFALVYIGDALAMLGGIPNRKNLLAMVAGRMEYGISENDRVEAAKGMGQD